MTAQDRGDFEVGPARDDELPTVARMHHEFFGGGDEHGHSIARLGVDFLEHAFYRPNADNPYFFADVARWGGEVVAFCVYVSDRRRVFRHTLRTHPLMIARQALRTALRRPRVLLAHLAGNVGLMREDVPAPVRDIPGWMLLIGVRADVRSREFRERTGIQVADELWVRMEDTLRRAGCREMWSAPFAHNDRSNAMFRKHGAEFVVQAPIQGVTSNIYRKVL